MKKRIIITALIVALAASALSGCGKKPVDSDHESIPTVSEEQTPSPESSVQPEASGKTESENKDDTQITSTPSATPTTKPSQQTPAPQNTPQSTTQPTPSTVPVQTPAPAPVESISVSDLMSKMVGALPSETHSLSEMPAEVYEGVYGINPADFDSVLIYGSMMNVHANEIIIIKAKDSAGVSAAKQALEQRHAALDNMWKRYLPDQYELVKAGTINTKGLYVTLVIADGAKKAVNAFNSSVK